MSETEPTAKIDTLPQETAPAAAPGPMPGNALPEAAATSSPAAKPPMSKAEKTYNFIVYDLLNYWVNLVGSIVIADRFNNGPWRDRLDWTVGKFAKNFEKMGVALEKSHHHTRVALETLALMSGGWLLLVPLKIMEDNKRKMVHWIQKVTGEDQRAPDGHEMTADEIYIAEERQPQSWWNVIKRRTLATVAVVGLGSLIDWGLQDKNAQKEPKPYYINPYDKANSEVVYHNGIVGGKEWSTNKIVGFLNKGIKHLPNGDKLTQENHIVQRYLSLGALDTIFTKITAMVMWVTRGAEDKKTTQEMEAPADKPVGSPEHVSPPAPSETMDSGFADRIASRPQTDSFRGKLAIERQHGKESAEITQQVNL